MDDAVTELMRALAGGIESHEAFCDQLVATADHVETEGPREAADVLRRQMRLHRVEAIKLGAQLVALVEQYGPLHQEQG